MTNEVDEHESSSYSRILPPQVRLSKSVSSAETSPFSAMGFSIRGNLTWEIECSNYSSFSGGCGALNCFSLAGLHLGSKIGPNIDIDTIVQQVARAGEKRPSGTILIYMKTGKLELL